jgi:adenylate kinase
MESRQTKTPELVEQLAMGKCRFKNIILFGPPGVGKGAQAEILSRGYGLVHLSTGEMIRQAIKEGNPLGLRVKEAVEAGNLADDDTVLEIIMGQIDRPEFGAGFVMDGFPRTVVQAERFNELMVARDKTVNCSLFLTAPEETIVERLAGRRVCSDCGSTYHARFKRPRIEGVCDNCHGEVVQRHDDNPAVYHKRLQEYQKRTTPLVNFYRDSGVMVEVNAAQPILDVAKEISKILDVPNKGED